MNDETGEWTGVACIYADSLQQALEITKRNATATEREWMDVFPGTADTFNLPEWT